MAQTHEFTVIQPPSSGEVLEHTIEAIRHHSVLQLELLPVQDIPVPQPESVALDVLQVTRMDGLLKVRGRTVAGEAVLITTHSDRSLAAEAQITKA